MANQVVSFHMHIVIAEHDELSTGLPSAAIPCRCSARPMLAHQLDPRPFSPPRVYGGLGRMISTGIIHDDDLHAVDGVVDREQAVER